MNYLVLYEMFVPLDLRGQGIGTRVLEMIEEFGRANDRQLVQLYAKPFAKDRSKNELINWYKKRGYIERSGVPGELEKSLTAP